jgi:hypothetical protein
LVVVVDLKISFILSLCVQNSSVALRVACLAGAIVYIYNSCNEVLASDAYAVLGIRHGASHQEARRAYRRLAAIYHPDKGQTVGIEQLELLRSARDEIIKGIADPLAIALPEWAAGDGEHKTLLIAMYIGLMSGVGLLAYFTARCFGQADNGMTLKRVSYQQQRDEYINNNNNNNDYVMVDHDNNDIVDDHDDDDNNNDDDDDEQSIDTGA